jgi:integrase/recombinase XerD
MDMERLSDNSLIDKFIKDCQIRGLSPFTIEGYTSNLNLFSSFLKTRNKNLISVNQYDLRDYISHLRNSNISQKTIENRFAAYSSLYDYAVYENIMDRNLVLDIRKRYLRNYKKNDDNGKRRKLISIDEMSSFINSIMDIRDKCIALLFAKTGIRRRELIRIDFGDIDWSMMSIKLKPTPKRSNRVVFFDNECLFILKNWLNKRNDIANPDCDALFISYETGNRLGRNGIYNTFIKWASKTGLHDQTSSDIEKHFTPHCCRHWFTTWLLRNGMPRDYVKELRGDSRKDAIDIYNHIDYEDLRIQYLSSIPKLGV